ncbi:hypothetical protein PInf_026317 [Phytophthora infestans]|nr:hypothetical protein PInf_026317 [Phytophthora infestans]
MLYSRSTSMNNSRRRRARLTASRLRRSKLLTEVAMRKMNLDPAKTMQMEHISEQLSADDISFFRHIFCQIDTDNSGIMLRSELHEALTLLGISPSDKELDEYLLVADADGSKAIDLQEWIVLCGMLVTPPNDEEDLLGAFQVRRSSGYLYPIASLFNTTIFKCLFPNEEDIPVVVFRTKMQRLLENAYAHLPDSNPHEVSCYVDDILSALDPNDTECIDVQECIRILTTPYHGKPYLAPAPRHKRGVSSRKTWKTTIFDSALGPLFYAADMPNGLATGTPVEVDEHTTDLWSEFADSGVECELCNEPYDDDDSDEGHIPRLLTCGHTYCQSCLDGWATHTGSQTGELECPTCRRVTRLEGSAGARTLPKNYELVRARQEMEAQTQAQLRKLKEMWTTQVKEKEQLAREAEEHARTAQRESVQASQKAMFLAKQVEINEQEKRRAQELAEEARHRALVASQQAEVLQAETENLKRQLQNDAAQLARVQLDASSAAAVAKELHSKAEQLQQQVDCVRAQLSLHAGRHDPSKLVVLVCEPTTVGSWLLPYTRYAVISIASDTSKGAQAIDPYQAAKTWTRLRQVEEPSSSVKVYRRYSDFVWLQRELQRQFPFELVPCVPGKQLFFNKEKEFVGERMRLLQAFLRGVLRQPLLAVTEEVRAFLLSTTEELESLRRATYSYYSGVEDDDLHSVDEDSPNDEVDSRSSSPPVSTSKDSTMSKRSSSWSAWGAVSAITSSAAKLVTTTGTALTGIGSKTGTAGLPEDPEVELSRSFFESEGRDAATRGCIERRRRYIDVARSYQSTAQKGGQLSRASRLQSHHLHRMCELLHDMNKLDQDHARRRRQRLAASKDIKSRQDDEDDDMETRAFDERASDVFSAISLNTKNDADCMEYALLEVVRMQTLELGGIEDAFARVRRREEALQAQQELNASSSTSLTDGASLSALSLKREELVAHRRELNDKVVALDPGRSRFVLQVLCKNTSEMHKLAKTKRKLFQASQQQLVGVQR